MLNSKGGVNIYNYIALRLFDALSNISSPLAVIYFVQHDELSLVALLGIHFITNERTEIYTGDSVTVESS